MSQRISACRLRALAQLMTSLENGELDLSFMDDQDTADIMASPRLWTVPTRLPLLLYPARVQEERRIVCGTPRIAGSLSADDAQAGRCRISRTMFRIPAELEPVEYISTLAAAQAGWRID